jgi:hypothetical protein
MADFEVHIDLHGRTRPATPSSASALSMAYRTSMPWRQENG